MALGRLSGTVSHPQVTLRSNLQSIDELPIHVELDAAKIMNSLTLGQNDCLRFSTDPGVCQKLRKVNPNIVQSTIIKV